MINHPIVSLLCVQWKREGPEHAALRNAAIKYEPIVLYIVSKKKKKRENFAVVFF